MSRVARPIGQPYLRTGSPAAMARGGDLVPAWHGCLRDDDVSRAADRLAGLEIAQGDEHVISRMHSQRIG